MRESKYLWEDLLDERVHPQWVHFEWLTVRALFESVNDKVTKFLAADIIARRRARWVTAQQDTGVERRPPGAPNRFGPDFVVDQGNGRRTSFLLIGDPGEADASQYAVVEPLLRMHDRTAGEPPTDFMVIVSDVIYPAGDVNEYVNAFYLPYEQYDRPIFALPGNHDWYDGLNGMMFHFCHSDPLAEVVYRWNSYNLKELLGRQLWRRASRPDRAILGRLRDERPPREDGRAVPVQPGPYYAIDTGPVLLVAIDTGVDGSLDADQGRWLMRISARCNPKKPKVLLTGKPIYVDGTYVPGEIKWDEKDPQHGTTVDDIVRDPSHRYVAVVGGDIHNYQRYPVKVTDEQASGENRERVIQYLVSGGGGAYLKGTHLIPPVGFRTNGAPAFGRPLPGEYGYKGRAGHLKVTAPRESAECYAAGDPDRKHAFRCYPLRGDSLTYFTRSFGPWLVLIVAGLMLSAAGALWAVVIASPPQDLLLPGLAPTALAAVVVVFMLARRRRGQDTADSPHLPRRYGPALAWSATAAVLLACVGVLLSLNGDAAFIALVAIGTPLALIAIPVLAYETRSVRPVGTAEVGLALPIGAIPLILVMRTDASANVKLLFAAGAAMVVTLLILAFGLIRPRLPRRKERSGNGDDVATWIGFAFTVALFLLWAGVATAILIDEPAWVSGVIAAVAVTAALVAWGFRVLPRVGLNVAFALALISVAMAANWIPLALAILLAGGLIAFPLGVTWLALRHKPKAQSLRERLEERPPVLTRGQMLLLLVAAAATVLSAADGLVGLIVAGLLLAAGVTVLLLETPFPKAPPLTPPLRESDQPDPWSARTRIAKVGVVLAWYAVVVALLALPGKGWAVAAAVTGLSSLLIFLTPVLLWFAAPSEVWRASNALLGGDRQLLADEAAAYVCEQLNAHTGAYQVRPVRPVVNTIGDKPDRHRLAATLYKSEFHGRNPLRDAWRTLVSEISDTDRPPFFKSFLRVDVDETTLRVRCFGVTGYEGSDPSGDRLPTLEDDFTIDLPDGD